ncbi:MAG: V-type ATP synthase subunit E family protein [Brevinematia bacterium]
MSVENVIKVVENEVEAEVLKIVNSAIEEKEKIVKTSKLRIEEEFEQKKKDYQEEIEKKLSLEKLFIESEVNKSINKTISEVFSEIYSEVVKELKKKFLSFHNPKDLILALIDKSVKSLQSDGEIKVILSHSDFETIGEEIKKEISEKYANLEIMKGEIEGGVLIKQGNITVDLSIDRIIKMFEPFIYNEIYKKLPKVTL